DLIQVAGTLRVREDLLSLTINVPEQLKVTRAEPVDRDIGTIVPEDQYLRVRVRGQVREVYEPYAGLTLIAIRDETGSIPAAIGEDLVALSGISPTLPFSTGQAVEAVATVSLYGDTPQLVPASVADIVPLSQPVLVASERSIGQLTAADVGQLVVVRGTVIEVEPFSAGFKLTLDDGTGAVILLLWQSVYDGLPDPAALGVGAEVQAQGEVSQYRGELELIPELADDVQMLTAAVPPAETTIGTLAASDLGRVVTLRGTLGPPDPFSAGLKFALDDGTGQVILLLWSNVAASAPEGLGDGTQVIVTGEIAEYQGKLELIPRNGDEIQVTGAGEAPTPAPEETPPPVPEAEARAISAVTSADVGATLLLTGTLGEPEPFSAGVKFPLDDGTGTIILLLWQNVYETIPDTDRLVAGTTVKVIGQIEEYQGELEIIPEADGITITGAGHAPTPEPAEATETPEAALSTDVTAINTITPAQVGHKATVQGTLGEKETFSAGIKFELSDGTGTIILLLWQNVYETIPDADRLVAGATVKVTGEIEEYRGELEIIPEADGVWVVE
ncbi:MAG: hypothetical protein SXV54_26210, partial [Chloroflexota bacterium]|nr:hypothetical protein [Chloroflexota bacterium]